MVDVGTDAATLFIPLVIGLVVQLSSIERGRDEELENLAGRNPFFLPGSKLVPSLGRLNFVHGTNLVLLLGCYVLATTLDPSILRTLLIIFVLIVWLQLPVLEVKQYGKLLNETDRPLLLRSFDLHLVSTVLIAAYVWQFGSLTRLVESTDTTLLEWSDFLRNGIVILLFVSWFLFLHALRDEIGDVSRDGHDGPVRSRYRPHVERRRFR